MILFYFSYGEPTVPQRISDGSHRFSMVFISCPIDVLGFPMIFLYFSHGKPRVPLTHCLYEVVQRENIPEPNNLDLLGGGVGVRRPPVRPPARPLARPSVRPLARPVTRHDL